MADEADAPPAMPKPTMRRASRGALAMLFASLGTVAVIAVGVVVGVRAFTAGTPERIPESVGPTGATSPSVVPAVPHSPFTAVDFVDTQHGWMADADGILATSDGGATWTRQHSAHGSITSFDFLDATHGWAVGSEGVLVTSDGSTWTRVSDEDLASVDFVSSTSGWGFPAPAPGPGSSRLLHTSDGGKTWTPDPAGIGFESVCFVDSTTGYAGMRGTVLKTTDGGSTWETISQVPGQWFASQLQCPEPNTVWALFTGEGAAGTLDYAAFRSGDGGSTWTAELTSPLESNSTDFNGVPTISNYPGPFAAVSADDAVFFGYCPACKAASTVMRTTDGTTWTRSTIDGFLPEQASFADAQHGWMVAQNGFQGDDVVLATSDGGATWSQVSP
jgi:photosystem II stability/assembly factor-like uncharacterized protein